MQHDGDYQLVIRIKAKMMSKLFILVLPFVLHLAATADEVTYPGFGTFTLAQFSDKNLEPRVLLPQSPDSLKPEFRLFTRKNLNHYQFLTFYDQDALSKSNFDPKKKTKLIIHGFLSNSEYEWIERIKKAYLQIEDCNVIKVDWRRGNGMPYSQAVGNTRIVGMMVGKFLEMASKVGAAFDSFHIIGDSLGAHIAGFAGKYLKGKIGQITGLDPAGPYFQELDDPSAHLWHTDAQFVEVIHTDGRDKYYDKKRDRILSIGTNKTLGHVDLFPNGGKQQPACENKPLQVLRMICNHHKAKEYYAESLERPESNAKFYQCNNVDDFFRGMCTDCGEDNQQCYTLGADSIENYKHLDYSLGKRFYLATTASKPYLNYQLVFTIKFDSGADQVHTFGLTPDILNDTTIMFYASDREDSHSNTFRGLVALKVDLKNVAEFVFVLTEEIAVDQEKPITIQGVDIENLSTNRNVHSPTVYHFVNPTPTNPVPSNKAVKLVRK